MYTEINGEQLKSGDLIRFPTSSSKFGLAAVTRITGDESRVDQQPMSFNAVLDIIHFVGVTVNDEQKKIVGKKTQLTNKDVMIVNPQEIEDSLAYSEPGKALIRETLYDIKTGKNS